jgi:hypothetical protein
MFGYVSLGLEGIGVVRLGLYGLGYVGFRFGELVQLKLVQLRLC